MSQNTLRSKAKHTGLHASRLRIGVGRRDMTPPVGIYARQWGAALHDVAEGVHRPLCVTAVAMGRWVDRQGGCAALLVVLDAGWWHLEEDEWRVRGPLIEQLGLDASQVMVSVTHTHAACSLCTEDRDKPGGDKIEAYLAYVAEQTLEASREAIAAMAPATLTWAYGTCDLATNRDLPDPDGDRVLCGFNPDGTPDQTLLVGRASDDQGRVLATLVNYACHPTTLAWDNRLISPDFCGAMCEVVEQATGDAPCLYLQGASGELAPAEQYVGDVAIADAHGRRLGYAALATLSSMLPAGMALSYKGAVESGAPLAMWGRAAVELADAEIETACIDVPLPLKPMPTEEELEAQLAACTDRTQAERIQRKIRVVRTVGSGPTCTMPAWIWRIGGMYFVGQANEAYSAFQMALRERYPDRPVAVMNLVNGACGYLSPPEKYDLDIYQVWQSPFDREALNVLTDACVRRIDAMMREPHSTP